MKRPAAEQISAPRKGHPSSGRKTARRIAGWTLLTLVSLAMAFSAGFIWFVADALRPAPLPPVADGIVALTGGSGRVEAALRLFHGHRGRFLLISGVDPSVRLQDLAPQATSRDAERITLGRAATSTVGNATETLEWATQHHIRSLIIVTAGYHVRRAVREISRAAPDLQLYPCPVQSPVLQRRFDATSLRILGWEYIKWLLAETGPAWMFRHRVDA
ncbi:YdcF family protein [Acetobacter sp. AN02]|uniref:YdcF family protein n=1 Tax=Acetobacter sp. AN02 TaxID=2894186 RepID=UPI0024344BFE|nr:YdcF family protein [Acetobacter sp. AN02]MDG6094409.1 YdcF family protein [Acetobacter sp. AN02]